MNLSSIILCRYPFKIDSVLYNFLRLPNYFPSFQPYSFIVLNKHYFFEAESPDAAFALPPLFAVDFTAVSADAIAVPADAVLSA